MLGYLCLYIMKNNMMPICTFDGNGTQCLPALIRYDIFDTLINSAYAVHFSSSQKCEALHIIQNGIFQINLENAHRTKIFKLLKVAGRTVKWQLHY
jgi:hypothetical protein